MGSTLIQILTCTKDERIGNLSIVSSHQLDISNSIATFQREREVKVLACSIDNTFLV